MAVQLPPCPASLRTVQHYLKAATDYDQRDPVISYWCRLYSLQSALKIDRSSQEAKMLLMALMDWLEKQKKVLHDNESVTNDVAAQAYIENAALKLFYFADGQDRAAVFGKDVVKAFYTAGLLFDVMLTFGELTEEITQNRKYAKWKAAYIHKCLKNGETPQPGPMRDENEEDDIEGAVGGYQPPPQQPGFSAGFTAPQKPPPGQYDFPDPPSNFPPPSNIPPPSNFPSASNNFPTDFPSNNFVPSPHSNPYNPPPTPTQLPSQPPAFPNFPAANAFPNPGEIAGDYAPKTGNAKLTADQMTKAQKYCKWAGSALSYDDVPTAITNIKKALRLLETGVDS